MRATEMLEDVQNHINQTFRTREVDLKQLRMRANENFNNIFKGLTGLFLSFLRPDYIVIYFVYIFLGFKLFSF